MTVCLETFMQSHVGQINGRPDFANIWSPVIEVERSQSLTSNV